MFDPNAAIAPANQEAIAEQAADATEQATEETVAEGQGALAD